MREFGAKAVYGDIQLPLEKMRSLLILSNLTNAWESREASKDWAEWAARNRQANDLLEWMQVIYGQRS